MASVLDLVKHYQHSIEKYPNDEQKILKCIDKLFNLGVTVQHLQETGVGRTVNALRKEPGDVGQAARSLVYKWKVMVATEESDQEEDHNNHTTNHNGHSHDKDSDDATSQSKNKCDSSSRTTYKDEKQINGNYSGYKKRYHSGEEEEPDTKRSKYLSSRESDDYKKKSQVYIKQEESNSESNQDFKDTESEESSSEQSASSREDTKHKNETKADSSNRHKSKHSPHSSHVDKKVSSSSKRKHESSGSHSRRNESKDDYAADKSSLKEKSQSSHSHRSSKDKEGSSSSKKQKTEHKSIDSEKKHKESKSSSKHSSAERHKSSSHKLDSSTEKHKNKSEKHDVKSEKHGSGSSHSSEKEKHKDEESLHKKKLNENIISSSTDKHSSSSRKHSKDHSSSSKEKSSSHSSEKKHSSKDSKSSTSAKKESEKSSQISSEKQSKHKSSSSSHKSSSSSSKEKRKEDIPKKKVKSTGEDSDDGIDCGSGASFAEALGMLSPSKPKKKTLKDASPTNSHNNDLSPATLLAPSARLAPLPALEITALPDISPHYKPRPPPRALQHLAHLAPPTLSDDDALSAGISSKNLRTKVYSGNKVIGKVPSLYELSVNVLRDHIDCLEFTGGVPYEILKPVVDCATPQQLFALENYNAYLMEDTDHLWRKFCEKTFRNKPRQEMESWRETYLRCQEEQEHKLKSLTANIKIAQEAKKAPIKQTKMAYVDSVVKPPRNIARKQAQHGTAHAAAGSPAARVAALAGSAGVLRGGTRPAPSAPSAPSAALKPKRAPLMAKALQFMRGRKR